MKAFDRKVYIVTIMDTCDWKKQEQIIQKCSVAISKDDVLTVYKELKKNQYGQYLKDVLDGKYIDM